MFSHAKRCSASCTHTCTHMHTHTHTPFYHFTTVLSRTYICNVQFFFSKNTVPLYLQSEILREKDPHHWCHFKSARPLFQSQDRWTSELWVPQSNLFSCALQVNAVLQYQHTNMTMSKDDLSRWTWRVYLHCTWRSGEKKTGEKNNNLVVYEYI